MPRSAKAPKVPPPPPKPVPRESKRPWAKRVLLGLLLLVLVVGVFITLPHWTPCATLCQVDCVRKSRGKPAGMSCTAPCQAGCVAERAAADPWGSWDRSRTTKSKHVGRKIRFGDVEIVVPEAHFPLKKLLKLAEEMRVPLARPERAAATRVDLRGQFRLRGVRIKNQGSTPTCMAHAVSTLMEYNLWDTWRSAPKRATKAGMRSGRVRISRKHLHSLSLHTLGVCDRGTDYGGWALQSVSRVQAEGTFAETYWPWRIWSPSEPRWRTCEEAMNGGEPSSKALAHRFFFVKQFHYLPPFSFKLSASARNPDDIEGVLAKGHPLVLGVFLVTSSFKAATRNGGFVPLPTNRGEKPDGGHYVVVVGYDRPKQRLVFANSWGASFGQGGFGYMSYAYVKKYAIEGLYIDEMTVKTSK